MGKYSDSEKTILNEFGKSIWRRFMRGMREYQLVAEGDRIAVCISGGKDSILLAKCMQLLKRSWKTNFDLEFLVMDPGYNAENRARVEENAARLDIPVRVFESDIFDAVDSMGGAPCYMCAKMRRGFLYKTAQSLGCNKIALGHHFDDVVETILMSMLYAGEFRTMMPRIHSANFPGMELIRPLYLVKEDDIIAWAEFNGLHFIRCACKVAEKNVKNNGEDGSKRQEMKRLVRQFRSISPNIDRNIFASAENVNLDTVISYRHARRNVDYHFLEDFERRE